MKPWINRPIGIIISIIIGVTGIGGIIVTNTGGGGSPPPDPGTANVWMVTGGTATCSARSSTPVTLASAPSTAKCSTVASACALMNNGDTTRLQEGTYASLTFATTCNGASGSPKTFDAENDETGCNRQMNFFVTLTSYNDTNCPVHSTADISIQGSWLVVNNMSTDDCLCFPSSSSSTTSNDITNNIHSVGFWMTGTNITINDGEAGGIAVCGTSTDDIGHIGFNPGKPVDNMTVDGYLIHDLWDGTGSVSDGCGVDKHADCLQLNQTTRTAILNTQFWNCATADIQSNDDFGSGYDNISYIGNYFGKVYRAGNAAEMGTTSQGSCTGTFIQAYNTYRAGAGSQVCGLGTANFIFEGNLQMDDAGPVGWETAGASSTVDYNVTTAVQGLIGTHGKTCTASFANANDVLDGFKLNGGDTCASNAGKPSSSVVLPTDIEGGTRAATPEAGADEIGVP